MGKEGGISIALWRVKEYGESLGIMPIDSPLFINFGQKEFVFLISGKNMSIPKL